MSTFNDTHIGGTIDAMTANRQWRERPDDQRYKTLGALLEAVTSRARASFENETSDLRVTTRGEDLLLEAGGLPMTPTNWSFKQLAERAGGPAGYLSRLPADIAAAAMNYGLEKIAATAKVLGVTGDECDILQAVTSPTYGRVWDQKVAEAAIEVIDRTDGRFFNPKDWSGEGSGLYASDRDIFVFLIDGGSIVDAGPRAQLSRGIIMWNSEVGSKTLGAATFQFNHVCGNHIIWGFQNLQEKRIRHTALAPERFVAELLPAVRSYADSSAQVLEETVRKAQNFLLAFTEDSDDKKLIGWIKDRGFTAGEARAAVVTARKEEGKCESLWDVVQGLTARARMLTHLDVRVELERRAGALLNLVSGK